MTDGPDNLILQFLRRIDAKVDRLAEVVHDIKVRLTAVEEGLVGVQRRIDRLEAGRSHRAASRLSRSAALRIA